MPNGRSHKEWKDYGEHSYEGEGTSDCKHGCGCWCGPTRSGGPVGIDPMGRCPSNPNDGISQGWNNDYEDIVNGRIRHLESEVYRLRGYEKLVENSRKNSKIDLIEINKKLMIEKSILNEFIYDLFEQINEKIIKYKEIEKT